MDGSPVASTSTAPAIDTTDDGKRKQTAAVTGKDSKKRKTGTACLFCRRSHMTCDDARPCTRCVRREIGHLCRDEPPGVNSVKGGPKQKHQQGPTAPSEETATVIPTSNAPSHAPFPPAGSPPVTAIPTSRSQQALSAAPLYDSYASFPPFTANAFDDQQAFRNEIYGPNLTDFLRTLDDPTLFQTDDSLLPFLQPFPDEVQLPPPPQPEAPAPAPESAEPPVAPLPRPTSDEKYLMTAADQQDGPRNRRLDVVIRAKFEAGLLKPFDYVAGYKRLMRWMETNMSASSRTRTLQTISEFRPRFRAIASGLRDADLIFVEEAFERLLLDYDRVFANMPIPACLWRRTGEIFKANVEFSQLVGVPIEMFREGRMAIYELMAGESAGNFWQRYGSICFDSTQKAVLTGCTLRNKTTGKDIPCAFSFTIRRDQFGLPSAVIGNFLPVAPSQPKPVLAPPPLAVASNSVAA